MGLKDEQQEFIELVNKHNKLIFKICHLYTDSKEDFKDLYQEIIYQLWKSRENFKNRSKISTWIYRVALNTALYRLRSINKAKLQPLDEKIFNLPEDETTNELMEQLKEMIEQLTPFEKSLLLLQLDGLSYKEIALITGLSETNVGTKLSRIKQKLKKIAKSSGF